MEKEVEGLKKDDGKPDWSLLDLKTIEGVVKVLSFGAKKYAPDNWKKVPNGKRRYFAAAMRHLTAWQSGEETDSESGLSHLYHVIANIIFLIHFDKK